MRFLSILLVVVLVAAGGLFYAAPVIAFYDIRSACQSQDVANFYIDYINKHPDLWQGK